MFFTFKSFFGQKQSWFSLSLLTLNYIIHSYLLAQAHQPLLIYLIIVIGYVLMQLIVLLSRVQQVRDTLIQWVVSDAIHFVFTLAFACLILYLLGYLKMVKDLLLVLTAESLARLDLQQAGLNQRQNVAVLTLCLILGLATGWIAHQLLLNL